MCVRQGSNWKPNWNHNCWGKSNRKWNNGTATALAHVQCIIAFTYCSRNAFEITALLWLSSGHSFCWSKLRQVVQTGAAYSRVSPGSNCFFSYCNEVSFPIAALRAPKFGPWSTCHLVLDGQVVWTVLQSWTWWHIWTRNSNFLFEFNSNHSSIICLLWRCLHVTHGRMDKQATWTLLL